MDNVFNEYSHLMREKALNEFTSFRSDGEYAYVPVRQLPVCVDISRSLKRLGLCTTTLAPSTREPATVVQIAVRKKSNSNYSKADAVKEVFNQINNLSARGILVGSYDKQLEVITYSDPRFLYSKDMLIIARPLVLNRGLDYVRSLSLHIEEGSQEVRNLED